MGCQILKADPSLDAQGSESSPAPRWALRVPKARRPLAGRSGFRKLTSPSLGAQGSESSPAPPERVGWSLWLGTFLRGYATELGCLVVLARC